MTNIFKETRNLEEALRSPSPEKINYHNYILNLAGSGNSSDYTGEVLSKETTNKQTRTRRSNTTNPQRQKKAKRDLLQKLANESLCKLEISNIPEELQQTSFLSKSLGILSVNKNQIKSQNPKEDGSSVSDSDSTSEREGEVSHDHSNHNLHRNIENTNLTQIKPIGKEAPHHLLQKGSTESDSELPEIQQILSTTNPNEQSGTKSRLHESIATIADKSISKKEDFLVEVQTSFHLIKQQIGGLHEEHTKLHMPVLLINHFTVSLDKLLLGFLARKLTFHDYPISTQSREDFSEIYIESLQVSTSHQENMKSVVRVLKELMELKKYYTRVQTEKPALNRDHTVYYELLTANVDLVLAKLDEINCCLFDND